MFLGICLFCILRNPLKSYRTRKFSKVLDFKVNMQTQSYSYILAMSNQKLNFKSNNIHNDIKYKIGINLAKAV
jgi:hypothetical protein